MYLQTRCLVGLSLSLLREVWDFLKRKKRVPTGTLLLFCFCRWIFMGWWTQNTGNYWPMSIPSIFLFHRYLPFIYLEAPKEFILSAKVLILFTIEDLFALSSRSHPYTFFIRERNFSFVVFVSFMYRYFHLYDRENCDPMTWTIALYMSLSEHVFPPGMASNGLIFGML